MWRALVVFNLLLLGAGVYVIVEDGFATHAASPEAEREDDKAPSTTDFGFALAAGAVALMATMMLTRPRFRFRR